MGCIGYRGQRHGSYLVRQQEPYQPPYQWGVSGIRSFIISPKTYSPTSTKQKGGSLHFNWDINVGSLLTAIIVLGGLYSAHIQNLKRLDKIEYRVGLMYRWFLEQVLRVPSEKNGVE